MPLLRNFNQALMSSNLTKFALTKPFKLFKVCKQDVIRQIQPIYCCLTKSQNSKMSKFSLK